MNRWIAPSALALIATCSPLLAATSQGADTKPTQSGIVVQGENGTKWCCPDGKKGPKCEQGVSTLPVGAACNFASALVVDEGITPAMSDRGRTALKPQAEAPRLTPAAQPAVRAASGK
ncbi:MAG: hypothetical protein HOQ32_06515 [Lysobacter sp.]|nr:hypothetical protein [Lysobacter sp.]